MKVLVLPEVRYYLKELQIILYEKDYFGFEEAAQEYTDELLNDILTTLPVRLHKPAPKYFDIYFKNMEYAVFKKSNRTSWYVFFTIYEDEETGEDIFLVRYIGNNHTVAHHL